MNALQARTTGSAATASLHTAQQHQPRCRLLPHRIALQTRTTGSAVTVRLHTAQQRESLRRLLPYANAPQTRGTAGSRASFSPQSAEQTKHRRHGLGNQATLERKALGESAANESVE